MAGRKNKLTMEKQKPDYEKVFNMFCDRGGVREQLNQPFKQKDIYASTDAHSMIYMPTSVEYMNFEEQNVVNVHGVIPENTHQEIPLNISQLEQAVTDNCILIDEIIKEEKDCKQCAGEGVEECDLGHEHDCRNCNGSGTIKSTINTGKKIPDLNTIFKFGGMESENVGIAYKQITRLIEATKELGEETIYKVYGKDKSPYIFKVGLTNIMVMPAMTTNDISVMLPFNFHAKSITEK